MAFLKRVFSSDYRRAIAAEAAGEYLEAARSYALAGERAKVAEMHLLAAERAGGADGRLAELRTAARWAEGDGPEVRAVRRRVARGLLEHVQRTGVLSDADRKLLVEAAQLFAEAGDHGGAGECYELAGDEARAGEAYQQAGDVERLERVLSLEEGRRHHGAELREAFAEYQLRLAAGARDAALSLLRRCAALEAASGGGPSRRLLEELSAKLIASGSVALRIEPARTAVVFVGAFPFGIGRETSCELPLRDGRVSRRHSEVLWREGRFLLRDHRSRNGTLLGGVRIEGELPLDGAGEIGLGDLVTIAFRTDGPLLSLEVVRGADRGRKAVASATAIPLGEQAASLRFSSGRPVVEASPGRQLLLNGARAGAPVQLLLGDEIEVAGEGGRPPLRVHVEAGS